MASGDIAFNSSNDSSAFPRKVASARWRKASAEITGGVPLISDESALGGFVCIEKSPSFAVFQVQRTHFLRMADYGRAAGFIATYLS
jgi:hypothetical protein